MIRLTSRTHVPAPPERVWEWLADMDARYRPWHSAHVAWRTLRGSPVTAGSIVYFHERIGWAPVAMRCRIAEALPNRYLRYDALFPHSLAGAGGSFTLDPTTSGCDITVEARMGLSLPIAGPILDALLRAVFPLRHFHSHLAEEGANLARLLVERKDPP